jgi:hypothetical protein
VPLIMDPKKFVMNTIGGLWLKMTPRAQWIILSVTISTTRFNSQ